VRPSARHRSSFRSPEKISFLPKKLFSTKIAVISIIFEEIIFLTRATWPAA
jgi:hypothetical protein